MNSLLNFKLWIFIILFFFLCVGVVNAESNNGNSGLINENSLKDLDKTLTIEITKNKIISSGNTSVSISTHITKKKPSKLSQYSIIEASRYVDSYVNKYGKLPNFVKISNYKFSIPEYFYLASKTIQYKYENNKSSIEVKYGVKDPQNIRGTNINGNISIKKFYYYVKEIISYINYLRLLLIL